MLLNEILQNQMIVYSFKQYSVVENRIIQYWTKENKIFGFVSVQGQIL